jgi:hypothetical protein
MFQQKLNKEIVVYKHSWVFTLILNVRNLIIPYLLTIKWNIMLFSEDINPAFACHAQGRSDQAEIPGVSAGILPKGRVHNSTYY